MRWRLLVLLGLLTSFGCSGPGPCPWVRPHQMQCYNRKLDDLLASKVARDVARQHMSKCYNKKCWPSCDFQAGFEQAYVDVAMGSDGTPPVVAPAPYWKSCQRTEDGHAAAREWLSGYEAGATRAVQCRSEFNRVAAGGVSCPCR